MVGIDNDYSMKKYLKKSHHILLQHDLHGVDQLGEGGPVTGQGSPAPGHDTEP